MVTATDCLWSEADEAYSQEYHHHLEDQGFTVGDHTRFALGAEVTAEVGVIGDHCYFGRDVVVSAAELDVADNVIIYSDGDLRCLEGLSIGGRAKLSTNFRLRARRCVLGPELWANENIDIGGGGWENAAASLTVGPAQVLGAGVSLNVGAPVELAGLGALSIEAMLLTHGGGHCQSTLDGYPWSEAGVTIGSHTVCMSRSVILPGVTIGPGSIVSAGSVVATDIGPGVLAAGNPARPVSPAAVAVSPDERRRRLQEAVGPLRPSEPGATPAVHVVGSADAVHDCRPNDVVIVDGNTDPRQLPHRSLTVIDLGASTISGPVTDTSERVRDRLRRIGCWLSPVGDYEPPVRDWAALVTRGIEKL